MSKMQRGVPNSKTLDGNEGQRGMYEGRFIMAQGAGTMPTRPRALMVRIEFVLGQFSFRPKSTTQLSSELVLRCLLT